MAAIEWTDVLVFGHTHQPWVAEYGGVLFANCGSVGKPKDGNPRAVAESGLPVEYAEKLVMAA